MKIRAFPMSIAILSQFGNLLASLLVSQTQQWQVLLNSFYLSVATRMLIRKSSPRLFWTKIYSNLLHKLYMHISILRKLSRMPLYCGVFQNFQLSQNNNHFWVELNDDTLEASYHCCFLYFCYGKLWSSFPIDNKVWIRW